jgi:hypothetical protein
MTLAIAILLLGVFSTAAPADSRLAQDSSAAPSQTASPSSTTSQENTSATSQSKSTAAQPGTPQGAPKAKTRPHKKKTKAANCDANTAGTTSNSTSATATGPSSSNQSGTTAAPGTPAQNCPPEKVVVPQGGTADPSIKLAGGGQTTEKREAANDLLGKTEENLKKISGQQLSTAQQETVTQIHQFVDQSKSALAAGDVERAQTLAWKAQVLSDDLANPK